MLHFVNTYHLTQIPISTLLMHFTSMFQQFYSPITIWLMGSPFPLKTGANKLNIHSSCNLSLNKISLNMFVKDFKHLSPPALNISRATPEGPLGFQFSFDSLHTAPLQSPFSTLHPLLASMLSLNSFLTFINIFIWSFPYNHRLHLQHLSLQTTPVFITITFALNPFSKLFFHL